MHGSPAAGQDAVVFLPKGSAEARSAHRGKAPGPLSDMNYDDVVRHAKDYAENDGIFVQDTPGKAIQKFPVIAQGYSTIAY